MTRETWPINRDFKFFLLTTISLLFLHNKSPLITNLTLIFLCAVLFLCVLVCIIASKRGRVTSVSLSRDFPEPNAPNFPNLKFLSEANVEKYLNLVGYNIVREITFVCEDLRGFREMVEMLQQWHLVIFNNLIQETNKTIGLEFYTNEDFGYVGTCTSYVSILITLLVY